eukprot:TRINITY_DN12928_c0_g1_i3.p1 TRINITY_DN12928_c0_g1~~TRINITY_DN12928_c0_g1_i3.p1  ORF type:complete len:602 (+),score=145.45 TRINITY_DN12928_c0_g1_i3:42-1808(+)
MHVVAALAVAASTAERYAEQRFVRIFLDRSLCREGCGCVKPGQRPSFFFKPGFGQKGQEEWLVLLSTGRLCAEPPCDTAADPFLASPPGVSTPDQFGYLAPPNLLGGLFSGNHTVNPAFYTANKVWLLDCTQDLWLGSNRSSGQVGGVNFASVIAHLADTSFLTIDPQNDASGPPTSLSAARTVFLVGEGLGGGAALALADEAQRSLAELNTLRPAELRVLLSGGWMHSLHTARPAGLGNCTPPAVGCPLGEAVEWRGSDGAWRIGLLDATEAHGMLLVRTRSGSIESVPQQGVRGLGSVRDRVRAGLVNWNSSVRWGWCSSDPSGCVMVDTAASMLKHALLVATSTRPPVLAWNGAAIDIEGTETDALRQQRKEDWLSTFDRDVLEGFFLVGEQLGQRHDSLLVAVECALDRILTTTSFGVLRVNGGDTIRQWVDRWVLGVGKRVVDWDTCTGHNCNPQCGEGTAPRVPVTPSPPSNEPLPAWGVLLGLFVGFAMLGCFLTVVLLYPNWRQRRERERHLRTHQQNLENALKAMFGADEDGAEEVSPKASQAWRRDADSQPSPRSASPRSDSGPLMDVPPRRRPRLQF